MYNLQVQQPMRLVSTIIKKSKENEIYVFISLYFVYKIRM